MARETLNPRKRIIGAKRTSGRRRRRLAAPEEKDSLEMRIVSFARAGKLKQAAKVAVESQLAAGLPVVYQAGNRIVREHPDGTREIVRTVDDAFQPVPARFRSLVVSKRRK